MQKALKRPNSPHYKKKKKEKKSKAKEKKTLRAEVFPDPKSDY